MGDSRYAADDSCARPWRLWRAVTAAHANDQRTDAISRMTYPVGTLRLEIDKGEDRSADAGRAEPRASGLNRPCRPAAYSVGAEECDRIGARLQRQSLRGGRSRRRRDVIAARGGCGNDRQCNTAAHGEDCRA